MLKALKARIQQKYRTVPFPKGKGVVPPLLRAKPEIKSAKCSHCGKCADACPTQALALQQNGPTIDAGLCLFCGECAAVCPSKAITFTNDFRLAANSKDALVFPSGHKLAQPLKPELLKLFARSLKLRQVSAGGCGACEADTNVLSTVVFDLARFGVQFVASPRHADGLLITGPVTKNMESALLDTYNALPEPKIVIAVGACAISGGMFCGHNETAGIPGNIPVSLYVPGCPPHPLTILDGILRLLGQMPRGR
ncbi:MAG: 4Fe-4S dicluster domain-containing protein [Elusimicrobia bacterium]|nr:4Fe-4S dicluster domain-containing protein [Elusimicrobiota bacterium]